MISIHKPVNRLMQEKKKLVMVKRMLNLTRSRRHAYLLQVRGRRWIYAELLL